VNGCREAISAAGKFPGHREGKKEPSKVKKKEQKGEKSKNWCKDRRKRGDNVWKRGSRERKCPPGRRFQGGENRTKLGGKS